MTHAYITLAALKGAGALNITGTANDDRLLGLAEAASDVIDRWCNRHFYALKATLRFEGDGGATLGLPDLVSVDSVRTYDGNGAATVWDAGDYELLPYNAAPAPAGSPNSRPYTRLLATGAGDRARFPVGRGSVEVSGVWGWQQRLRRGDGDRECRIGRRGDIGRAERARRRLARSYAADRQRAAVCAGAGSQHADGGARGERDDARAYRGEERDRHIRVSAGGARGCAAACRADVAGSARRRG